MRVHLVCLVKKQAGKSVLSEKYPAAPVVTTNCFAILIAAILAFIF
jgi:hypothetical protein